VTDERKSVAPERPGRYQRSIGGGVGSLIVLVVVVLAFVGFRALFRDNPEVEPEAVDYLAVVAPAQQAGMPVVYPRSLPSGWRATSVDYTPGERPAWGVGMLTDDGKFVGLRQQDADLSSLLETYGVKSAVEGDTVTVDGALPPRWQEWSDPDGDHAYAASVGEYEVLVYGSAPVDDLLTVVRLLTDAPATAG
jgi:hypothetical protein